MTAKGVWVGITFPKYLVPVTRIASHAYFQLFYTIMHQNGAYNQTVLNKNGRKIKYKINRKPSTMKKLSKSGQYAAKKAEHKKSSVRAKVEHVLVSENTIPRSAKTDRQTEYYVCPGKPLSG